MGFVNSENIKERILGSRALDIDVSEDIFCLILGYLAAPGRVGFIEAQIPEDEVVEFQKFYHNQEYYSIKQVKTINGNKMKQGCQFRIYFNNIKNCQNELLPYIGEGNTGYCKRINKGKFIEKIVDHYRFKFGHQQDATQIRNKVKEKHPKYIEKFDDGLKL